MLRKNLFICPFKLRYNRETFFYIRIMKRFTVLLLFCVIYITSTAQPPQTLTSGQILQAIKKLKVLGSVLYIAAHPDDENTRLITYLANEKLYRTGYLSLTRGDGGQNLVGDEQGVELGLIRTQELLAARRIDGGEQFFSSAYDFGYSKNPDETFAFWDKEKILSDVVWVIRNFKPDVIITRFPATGEGGHGHHTASAILANEAFVAAADSNRFRDQLKYVEPWQAKRILWNTFNFGGNNTTSDTQFKIDVGGFNPLLGKGYGEIAAWSRSQHKSQGFGSGAVRGASFEYFKATGGNAPQQQLLDDVNTGWGRLGKPANKIAEAIAAIEQRFDAANPAGSVGKLVELYKMMDKLPKSYWQQKKMKELEQIIVQSSGLYFEVNSPQQFAVQTDSLKLNVIVNNRMGANIMLQKIDINNIEKPFNILLEKNKNVNYTATLPVTVQQQITQPFWLQQPMDAGRFHINDQKLVGVADVEAPYTAKAFFTIDGLNIMQEQPVRYRFVDPVKGELYQPLYVVPPATVTTSPGLIIFKRSQQQDARNVNVSVNANTDLQGNLKTAIAGITADNAKEESLTLPAGSKVSYPFKVSHPSTNNIVYNASAYANLLHQKDTQAYYLALASINYDHIPSIKYFYPDFIKVLNIDLKTAGKTVGYIAGAGDKVAEILQEMGYNVTLLDQNTVVNTNLAAFDAIITGVRAYNTNNWMNSVYDKLMNYVKDGGNLIVQYNTSSNIGPLKAKIGPYNFNITRNRITDETAQVKLLDSLHSVFNFPNKISEKDFNGWIQERSIYHAGNWDSGLVPLISMADPGEKSDDGSLVIGKFGKGYFTYTGLVFFRQLPAAVPGAIRLMANLIALNAKK